MDDSEDTYLKTVCDYVHLNPERLGLVKPKQKLSAYGWSSYVEYLKAPRDRWSRLKVDRLLRAYHIAGDNAAGQEGVEKLMELRRAAGDEEFRRIERGWCFGGKEFKQELLELMGQQTGTGQSGLETRRSKNRRLAGLSARNSRNAIGVRHAGQAKGHPEKLEIAARLRRETTVTFEWIAEHLRMGATTSLSNLLYWAGRKPSPKARNVRR